MRHGTMPVKNIVDLRRLKNDIPAPGSKPAMTVHGLNPLSQRLTLLPVLW